jgi:hypothetical protein
MERAMKAIGGIITVGFAVLFCSLFIKPFEADADRGMLVVSRFPAVVTEEAQKAIIMYNLEEEALILGTDLKADRKTGVLEFIPFPAEPSVSLAPEKAFSFATGLVRKHNLSFETVKWSDRSLRKGGGEVSAPSPVEIRFNARLGAHDLTVIKVNEPALFTAWVDRFFKQKGLPRKEGYPDIEAVVDDYVKRGIIYFVLDYVEVTEEARSIDPVLYGFKTKELYYPLKTSNTVGGKGTIDLIVFAPEWVCAWGRAGGCFGLGGWRGSTIARVHMEELKGIYPDAGTLFKDASVFMQVAEWRGTYEFTHDILYALQTNWVPVPGVPWLSVDADRVIRQGNTLTFWQLVDNGPNYYYRGARAAKEVIKIEVDLRAPRKYRWTHRIFYEAPHLQLGKPEFGPRRDGTLSPWQDLAGDLPGPDVELWTLNGQPAGTSGAVVDLALSYAKERHDTGAIPSY